MKPSIIFFILFFIIGCQPLHVKSTVDIGIQPIARTFIRGEETWVELKTMIPAEGKEWTILFQSKVTPEFKYHIENPYQIIEWKVRNRDEKPIETKYNIMLVNENTSKKVEVDLSTQTSNAIKETLRVMVRIIH